jgi:multiple sugar transport system permease protein/raffinose/stachyose/melibiose transport system permease protein
MRNNKFIAAVLTPIFIFLIAFSVLPVAVGLVISLFDYKMLAPTQPFVGLNNIIRLFSDNIFFISLKNTLVFVVVTVSLNIIVTLILAQSICSMKHLWIRGLMRVLFFMPCVAPLVASSVVGNGMYNFEYGLINILLKQLFNMPPQSWLGSAATLMPAIIVFTLWADIGYNIIILTAGIDGVPSDMIEAAAIDGAGTIRRFFSITLPMLGRTMSFVVAMTLISHFQMFAQFMILNRAAGPVSGGPDNAGMVLTLYTYKTAFTGNMEMGYGSAIALVLFVILLIFTLIQQRLSRVDWGY